MKSKPQTLSLECYALELRADAIAQGLHPERGAFVDACNARGTDARTRQFKHYDAIVKWMCANWGKDGGPLSNSAIFGGK